MEIHIGRLIEARILEVGMAKAEFGRRINTSRQNINTLLRKKSLDSALLKKICRVLNYDFFEYYTGRKSDPQYSEVSSPKIKLIIELSEENRERVIEMMGEDFRDLFSQL